MVGGKDGARRTAERPLETQFLERVTAGLADKGYVDAGRSLMIAWYDSASWVQRQVTRFTLRDDGCTHRQDSYDVRVPPYLLDLEGSPAESTSLIRVPITLYEKDPVRHNISVRDGSGRALAALNTLELAVLFAVYVIALLNDTNDDHKLVHQQDTAPNDRSTDLALRILDLVSDHEHAPDGDTCPVLQAAETSVRNLSSSDDVPLLIASVLLDLESSSFLIIEVPREVAASPLIVKFSSGQGLPREREVGPANDLRYGRLRGGLYRLAAKLQLVGAPWGVHETLLIDDLDFATSQSRHLEYTAASGLLVTRISALAGFETALSDSKEHVANETDLQDFLRRLESKTRRRLQNDLDSVGEHGVKVWVGHVSGRRRSLPLGNPRGYTAHMFLWYFIDVAVERGPLVYAAVAGSWMSLFASLGLAFGLYGPAGPFASSPAASRSVPILISAAIAYLAWLGIGREHPVASDLLRPFRWVIVAAVSGAIITGMIALLYPEDAPLWSVIPGSVPGSDELSWLAQQDIRQVVGTLVSAAALLLVIRVMTLLRWTVSRSDETRSDKGYFVTPRPTRRRHR